MSRRLVLTCCLFSLAVPPVFAAKTVRVSVDSDGNPTPSGLSDFGSISTTGRFAAFDSAATTLVADDTNGRFDVFFRDLKKGKTTRVSVASSGGQSEGGDSYFPSISGKGRFIAFESGATNLVDNDNNGGTDIFVHDRKTGETTRASVASDGTEANGASEHASISANGRYVAFVSYADNLVADDHNGKADAFVHDRRTKETFRVSVGTNGTEAVEGSGTTVKISAKSRAVVFNSTSSDLVDLDTNGNADIFVHDWKTKQTTRVSVDSNGAQTTAGDASDPAISANGRFVSFISNAPNLVADDTNGMFDVFVHDRKTGITARASVDSNGTQVTDAHSQTPTLSRNGRFVLFESSSAQLVALDTNNSTDVFVHDRKTGKTTRASVASDGTQSANPGAYYPAISANGKFAIFTSNATDLAGPDSNDTGDIFVRAFN